MINPFSDSTDPPMDENVTVPQMSCVTPPMLGPPEGAFSAQGSRQPSQL